MNAPHRGRYGRRKATAPKPSPQLFHMPVQPKDTDERYTPQQIFEDLGLTFSIDVAAPPGGVPWVPAQRFLTADDDGLSQPWDGPFAVAVFGIGVAAPETPKYGTTWDRL